MFVGMGISAIIPVLDGMRMFGLHAMENQMGLSWVVLQGALYIFGAGLYAVSRPKLWWPMLTLLGSDSRSMVSWQS